MQVRSIPVISSLRAPTSHILCDRFLSNQVSHDCGLWATFCLCQSNLNHAENCCHFFVSFKGGDWYNWSCKPNICSETVKASASSLSTKGGSSPMNAEQLFTRLLSPVSGQPLAIWSAAIVHRPSSASIPTFHSANRPSSTVHRQPPTSNQQHLFLKQRHLFLKQLTRSILQGLPITPPNTHFWRIKTAQKHLFLDSLPYK
jgi:hypothetical protein